MRKTIISTVALVALGLGTGDASAFKVGRGTVNYVCGKGVSSCTKCQPRCFNYECKGKKCTMTLIYKTTPQSPKKGKGIAPLPEGPRHPNSGTKSPSKSGRR